MACAWLPLGLPVREQRIRFVHERPRGPCRSEAQSRTCTCIETDKASCTDWSGTAAVSFCHPGCGDLSLNEVRWDKLREVCGQTQGNGTVCNRNGYDGRVTLPQDWCPLAATGDMCDEDAPMLTDDTCPPPPPSPPPVPSLPPPSPYPPAAPGQAYGLGTSEQLTIASVAAAVLVCIVAVSILQVQRRRRAQQKPRGAF